MKLLRQQQNVKCLVRSRKDLTIKDICNLHNGLGYNLHQWFDKLSIALLLEYGFIQSFSNSALCTMTNKIKREKTVILYIDDLMIAVNNNWNSEHLSTILLSYQRFGALALLLWLRSETDQRMNLLE